MKSNRYGVLLGLYVLQSASASAQIGPPPQPQIVGTPVEFACGGNVSGNEFHFYFEKNSSHLPEDYQPQLDCIAQIYGVSGKPDGSAIMHIVGYRSQAEAASPLAAKRAKAVAKALEKRGVLHEQIDLRTCASAVPEIDGSIGSSDEDSAQINRQAYVIIDDLPGDCT